jgi:hypothetical protein
VGEATTTVVEAELFAQFGSVSEEHGALFTFAVFVMLVPGASPRFALTTSGKDAVAFAAREAIVHVIVPVPPTAGNVPQFHPAGTPNETNVVPVGIVSVNVTIPEAAGPLFVTACV